MLSAGNAIELVVEKPVAGGRMLSRHDGRIIFVQGAIPGERVRARIERVEGNARQLAFASVLEVLEPSADRRLPRGDPFCGGCAYAHVAYPRQLALKADLIRDAFARLGRVPLDGAVDVAASPETAYRMRARVHVRDGRIGFFREGSHDICDPRQTAQLRDDSVDAIVAAVEAALKVSPVASAELSENIDADERVVHFELPGAAGRSEALQRAMSAGALSGATAAAAGRMHAVGSPTVSDSLPVLTGGRAGGGRLHRHAAAFFQANRYLLPGVVQTVLDAVLPDGRVLDLYAGVGLFAVSLAHSGRERITAVEGDRVSAADLARNAADCGQAVRVVAGSVEGYLAGSPARPQTLIVDPPRTGISRAALVALSGLGAQRIVYVSCDPPTMARDARRLLDGGYRLSGLQAFDLFPNTPHVETVGVFDAVNA